MTAKRHEIVVVNGPLAGRRFTVGESALRLGRSSSNDIQVPDEELSRNHCLLEPSGETGVRITDLASANGTFVNGAPLGGEAVELKPGDEIAVGATTLRVVGAGEPVPPGRPGTAGVDLGLGASALSPAKPAKRRSPVANALWAVAAILLAASTYLVMTGGPVKPAPAPQEPAAEARRVVEMRYEKVAATSESVFRYYMELSPGGAMRVEIDDMPGENRHVNQTKMLGDSARARLDEILLDPDLEALDRQYAGPDSEPPELKSWRLKVVYGDSVKTVSVVNTQEPEPFRRVREKLEAFTKNELGIWAIQRSRAQLVEMAAASAEVGRTKWEDRDVQHGNLHASMRAYREALFYLETVNPKPAEFAGYKAALEAAEAELESRCREQRFKVDRAINLGDWETARSELMVLCQMIPDRDDDRNREASAKLVDVEKRIKNGGSL